MLSSFFCHDSDRGHESPRALSSGKMQRPSYSSRNQPHSWKHLLTSNTVRENELSEIICVTAPASSACGKLGSLESLFHSALSHVAALCQRRRTPKPANSAPLPRSSDPGSVAPDRQRCCAFNADRACEHGRIDSGGCFRPPSRPYVRARSGAGVAGVIGGPCQLRLITVDVVAADQLLC
jgi:hypothetical protein